MSMEQKLSDLQSGLNKLQDLHNWFKANLDRFKAEYSKPQLDASKLKPDFNKRYIATEINPDSKLQVGDEVIVIYDIYCSNRIALLGVKDANEYIAKDTAGNPTYVREK